MWIRPIGFRLILSLVAISGNGIVAAQTEPQEEETETTVVVTGSRIPTVLKEGPSPVTSIGREAIEKRGFTTILEAASSLNQISGAAQNETDTNGFTPNAGAIDLRALGPGRTLILVDGRRLTDYPFAYNSESNFVNLNTIPAAAVERIELLSGGASAIYGSDAVAGVLNIVLRKTIETPLELSARFGDTTQGGGSSSRIQGVGGWHNDRLSMTYAAEYFHRSPLYGLDRNFMDSIEDNPVDAARINPRALLRSDPFDLDGDGFDYVDPGPAACAPFPHMEYSTRPGRGNYCGQPDYDAGTSIRNKTDRASVYGRADFALTDTAELYGSLNVFHSKAAIDSNFSYYYPEISDYVFNTATDPYGVGGTFETLQRFFQLEEIGGHKGRDSRYNERSFDVGLGIKGNVFSSSNWRYDLSYSTSRYRAVAKQRALLGAAADAYFIGPLLGVESINIGTPSDPFEVVAPVYNFDVEKMYEPITPEIWDQLTDIDRDVAHSTNNVVQAVFNGELFNLPAGPLGVAVVVEAAKQDYHIATNPAKARGDFWLLRGTGGSGERKRTAAGLEFKVPVLESVSAQLAGRYDDYDDVTDVNGAFSYNLGLEFRPIAQLLFRGSLATSFRAPDMHYIFADPSGFFVSVTDEYLCRRDEPDLSFPECTNGFVNIEGTRAGNINLEEEKGKSYTLGLVAEPLHGLTFKADYYRIRLSGAVLDNPLDRILELEADCRLGETKGGTAVDSNSGQCQDALSRVQRNPADGSQFAEQIQVVGTGPINSARIVTTGIDATAGYRWVPNAAIGTFDFELGWSHTLKYDETDFAGDPVQNLRDDLQIFNWRSRMNASIGWSFREFESTLYMERYGSTPNWAETGRLGAVKYFNLSAGYNFFDGRAQASIFVDNLFDKDPPRDPTFDTYPYFSGDNYSPIGREVFLQVRYNFGGS